jgi:hypothetical protein
MLGGGEDRRGVSGRGESQDFGFVGIELDAERVAEGGESLDEPGEIIIHEKKKGSIDVREVCGREALAIITRLTGVEAVGGSLKELCVDWLKQLMEDKTDNNRGKGIALRETFMLEENSWRSHQGG